MFLSQALSADRSCQKAVDEAAIKRLAAGMTPCSTHTGAYCRARARLPMAMVQTLTGYVGQWVTGHVPRCLALARSAGAPGGWHDGGAARHAGQPERLPTAAQSTARTGLPAASPGGPYLPGQRGGAQCRDGPCRGKGGDEQSLLRSSSGPCSAATCCSAMPSTPPIFLLCTLGERGIDAVFEQHGARRRSTDFRRGYRLGGRDHLIVLTKPVVKPDWMSQADYAQAPPSLTVRELRTGGKTLVTTLLCPNTPTKLPCARFIAAAGMSNSIYATSRPRSGWSD